MSLPFALQPRVARTILATTLCACALTSFASATSAAIADEELDQEIPEHAHSEAREIPPPAVAATASSAASGVVASSSATAASPPSSPAASATAVPPEQASVSRHSLRVDGHKLDYTATAGNLLLRDTKGEAEASVFYVAYTVPTKDSAQRPVTFLFNGGPGAASIFLLMGSVGPKRVHTASPAATPPAPYVLADNPDTLLNQSDLVFIDAVGTGFSKTVGRATGKRFWGVDDDLDAFVRFIDRYLTTNRRWNSPKFLVGESYGATRAAMLAYRLGQHEIALNGVVLLSAALNANVHAPGYDLAAVGDVPTYAAIAWYHDKLPLPKPPDLPAFLDEVRTFAAGPYASALAQGDTLPDAQRDAVAAQLARYIGLEVQTILGARLRIRPSQFRKQLLQAHRHSVGRYDGRVEGVDTDNASDTPDYDASERYITSAFDAALHQHLAQDLHYEAREPYRVFNDTVSAMWDWKHRQWWGERLQLPYAAGDLAEAMRQNPHLRVLSANGYFDLATPFFSTEYDLTHMALEPSLQANLRITHYASGHMIYLDDAALRALKADMTDLYNAALHASNVPKTAY
ncbi:S10 family peptidase [Trinickia fusca]|uniref:Peptidase S10 n=1 Tax=Trinickia fusca TaxID=2419777 RepID=A0A494X4B7_9BURK|nr:peptidase S10 [Trinickia fusca]RKP45190.1 peptidase S10 [Trinickia fusca]